MAYTSTLSPNYYKRGKAPVWDFIREQGLNFHLGNAVKYICRAGYKGSTEEDLEKAIVYLQNELTNAKRQNLPGHYQTDSIKFTGCGVQGGLSDYEFSVSPSSWETAEADSGRVQRIFGGGGDTISLG